MPADELPHAVAERVRARRHRAPGEEALEIVGQRGRGRIAPLRLPLERHERDGVEIALEAVGEPGATHAGDRGLSSTASPRARRDGQAGSAPHATRGALDRLARDLFGEALRGGRPSGMRQLAGDELVEQHAERVDVGRHRHRLAEHLFGGGVGGGQGAHVGAGQTRIVLGLEELGEPEVEELRLARRRDQDVRGFEVAMHHEVPMRGVDTAGDFDHQADALGERQRALARVVRDRLAVDALHGEPGASVRRHAAVEKTRDGGVREAREDLALAAEARRDLEARDARPHELHRRALGEAAVDASRRPTPRPCRRRRASRPASRRRGASGGRSAGSALSSRRRPAASATSPRSASIGPSASESSASRRATSAASSGSRAASAARPAARPAASRSQSAEKWRARTIAADSALSHR